MMGSDLFDQIDNAAPEFCILDPQKGFRERQSVGGREKVIDVRWRRRRGVFAGRHRQSFKEEGYWDVQNVSEVLEPTSTDPIGTLFVFLYLLEGQADGVAEVGLAHSEHQPTHAHPSAHMFIGGVRGFGRHDWIVLHRDLNGMTFGYQGFGRSTQNKRTSGPLELGPRATDAAGEGGGGVGYRIDKPIKLLERASVGPQSDSTKNKLGHCVCSK
jgi:hypothetical protein